MFKRGFVQTTHMQTCFPEKFFLGLSIKRRAKHASVKSIGRHDNKVKLSPASSNTFEKSRRSNDKPTPRIKQNSIWKHLHTIIC